MKTKTFLLAAITAVLFIISSYTAQAGETVRGFLVDLQRVDELIARGAQDIKIFAAYDKSNKPYYVMVGINGQGAVIPGQVYRQNETGDCPPSCDFLPTALTNGGAYIDPSEASGLINNYMGAHPNIDNAVKICAYSLSKVKSKGYHYMRITFERNVKVTGVKDNGRVRWFAPFTHSCNTHIRESLTDS